MNEDRKSSFARLVEKFEQLVVFRIARGYFFVTALVAALGVVVGVFMGAAGVVRIPVSKPDEPAPIATPEPLSLARVDAWLGAQAQDKKQAGVEREETSLLGDAEGGQRAKSGPDAVAATREQLEGLVAKLKALFDDPQYSWANVYEKKCRARTSYGCLQWDKELKKQGVSEAVSTVLRGKRLEERIAFLQVLINVVGAAPMERRGELIVATTDAYNSINRKYLRQVEARDADIARLQAEYESEVQEQQASKARMRIYAAYSAGVGFALIVAVSLFLVHLAIERHMRVMKELLAVLGQASERGPQAPGGGKGAAVG